MTLSCSTLSQGCGCAKFSMVEALIIAPSAGVQAGMFNDRSTHSERQQVLQKLMQKGTAALGEGVPSDAELNSLLARSKAELVSFAQATPCSPTPWRMPAAVQDNRKLRFPMTVIAPCARSAFVCAPAQLERRLDQHDVIIKIDIELVPHAVLGISCPVMIWQASGQTETGL